MPQRQDARVAFNCDRTGANVGAVLEHGGKLVELEGLATLAHPVLQKKHMALARQA